MRRFLQNEQAQDLVEYSLLLAFVSCTVLGVALAIQSSIGGVVGLTAADLSAAVAAASDRIGKVVHI